jgi:3D (Asp-Asp-Asp) domain-containing protein
MLAPNYTDKTEYRPRQAPIETEVSRGLVREETLIMEATGYCSCSKCCGKSDGITATGVKASELTVSADWSVLPPGTRVYISGVGERIVQDRGGGIQGNRLDVWCPDHKTAKNFGRQTLEVRIRK